jgi:uncharacterized RDD family membrane protein YckC
MNEFSVRAPVASSAALLLGALPAGAAIHAGVWRRYAALSVDLLVFVPPLILLDYLPMWPVGWDMLLCLAWGWPYWAGMESSAWQATLGKRLLGIKVVDGQGRRIGFGRATGRYFAKLVSSLVPFFLGFFMADYTTRKQALHDLIASTFVVFRAVQPGQPLPAQRRPMPWYGWLINFSPCLAFAGVLAMGWLFGFLGSKKVEQVIPTAALIQSDIDRHGCRLGPRPPPHPWVEQVEVSEIRGQCDILFVFGFSNDIPGPLRHEGFHLTRKSDGRWSCSTNMAKIYRPASCTEWKSPFEQPATPAAHTRKRRQQARSSDDGF